MKTSIRIRIVGPSRCLQVDGASNPRHHLQCILSPSITSNPQNETTRDIPLRRGLLVSKWTSIQTDKAWFLAKQWELRWIRQPLHKPGASELISVAYTTRKRIYLYYGYRALWGTRLVWTDQWGTAAAIMMENMDLWIWGPVHTRHNNPCDVLWCIPAWYNVLKQFYYSSDLYFESEGIIFAELLQVERLN